MIQWIEFDAYFWNLSNKRVDASTLFVIENFFEAAARETNKKDLNKKIVSTRSASRERRNERREMLTNTLTLKESLPIIKSTLSLTCWCEERKPTWLRLNDVLITRNTRSHEDVIEIKPAVNIPDMNTLASRKTTLGENYLNKSLALISQINSCCLNESSRSFYLLGI